MTRPQDTKPEADDEVGKPLWPVPEPGSEPEPDSDDDSEEINPEEIVPEPRPAAEQEGGLWAPQFDPEQQREWERREKDRRDRESEENEKNDRHGVWEFRAGGKRRPDR
jgi:hypothetical protein